MVPTQYLWANLYGNPDVEASLRTLLLLRSLLEEIPRIVLVTRGDAVDARPELFDCVLEVRDDQGGSSSERFEKRNLSLAPTALRAPDGSRTPGLAVVGEL